ncbi:hypothetical protein DRQ33_07885 [bacterium]|nr:MAG: hypothetical protein DRQ33_07885 [bacterium]
MNSTIPKFFGQFLLEKGCITQEQLFKALQYQQVEDATKIGEIAIQMKLMTPKQVERVHQEQRLTDKYFGELAISMGYITEQQLKTMIKIQKNNHIFLGQALVELGFLTKQQIQDYLREFHNEQRPISSLQDIIPRNFKLFDEIFSLLDVSIKIFRRMADLHLKLGKGFISQKTVNNKYLISMIRLSGSPEMNYFLNLPQKVACSITKKIYNDDELDCNDEIVKDCIGEIANIICGNAISHILEMGKEISMSPPISILSDEKDTLTPLNKQKIILFPGSVQTGKIELGVLYYED